MLKGISKNGLILSASRMTDMPKYYPVSIIEETEKRLKKGIPVHTLVLWTKHPKSLLINPLNDFLIFLKRQSIQLYLQLTISGLGGIEFGKKSNGEALLIEPYAPLFTESLQLLPEIIDLIENPHRIRLRIDPIVRITDAENNIFSSLKNFKLILKVASQKGITNFSFSFLEKSMHQKVDNRFTKIGCEIFPPDEVERKVTLNWINKLNNELKVQIQACCIPGLPESKCIDAQNLQKLHINQNIKLSNKEPRNRLLCGCSSSIDIGGWPPKPCYTGCLYCYSRPVIK